MKYVYLFSEGNAEMRNLLGGKGANLAEMIPMLEIYKNEKLIDKVVGYATKEEIEDLLK